MANRVKIRKVTQSTAATVGPNEDGDPSSPRIEPYGLASMPIASNEGVEIELDTESDERIVVVAGPIDGAQGRPTLQPGEVAIYTQVGGQSHILKANGDVLVGGPAAALAVARATDPIQLTVGFLGWLNTVAAAAGVPPWPLPLPVPPDVGTIQSGSTTVKSV